MKIVNGKLVKIDDAVPAAAAAPAAAPAKEPAKAAGSGDAPAAAPRQERRPASRPGDWECPKCGANVFASKLACFKCRTPKPGSEPPPGVGAGSAAPLQHRFAGKTTEGDVGITHFLNNGAPWDCIIKHRYADFVVQEIDESGQVCLLGDVAAPPEPEEEAAAAAAKSGEEPKGPTTEDGLAHLAAEELVPPADVEKLRTLLTSFGTGSNAAPGVSTMDGLDYVILSPCDDKDKRRSTHEAVRKFFDGFESDVAEVEGAKCIRVRRGGRAGRGGKRKKGPGGDRQAKRQAFDPREGIKASWPEDKPKFCEFTLCKEGKDTLEAIDIIGKLLRRNTNAFSCEHLLRIVLHILAPSCLRQRMAVATRRGDQGPARGNDAARLGLHDPRHRPCQA